MICAFLGALDQMCVNLSFSSCLRELLLCTCSQCPPPSNVPPPPPLERELDLQTSNHCELPESLWQELASALALISPDNFVVFLSSNLALAVYLPVSAFGVFSPVCTCLFSFQKQYTCLEISVRVT